MVFPGLIPILQAVPPNLTNFLNQSIHIVFNMIKFIVPLFAIALVMVSAVPVPFSNDYERCELDEVHYGREFVDRQDVLVVREDLNLEAQDLEELYRREFSDFLEEQGTGVRKARRVLSVYVY